MKLCRAGEFCPSEMAVFLGSSLIFRVHSIDKEYIWPRFSSNLSLSIVLDPVCAVCGADPSGLPRVANSPQNGAEADVKCRARVDQPHLGASPPP
jgi:hypothetical protein